MKITEFTLDELNMFRTQCSFTESEAACFEMKAKDETDVAIAFALNVSSCRYRLFIKCSFDLGAIPYYNHPKTKERSAYG